MSSANGHVDIGGTAAQGETIFADVFDPDRVYDEPGGVSYTWYANGVEFAGGLGVDEVELTQDEVGMTITVVAAYTEGLSSDGASDTASYTGAPIVVADADDAPTGSILISGMLAEGNTLTASNDLSDADGMGTVTYHWYSDNVEIATGDTLFIGPQLVGPNLHIEATYTDGGGFSELVVGEDFVAATAGIYDIGSDSQNEGTDLVFTVTLNGSSVSDSLTLNFSFSDGTTSPADHGNPIFDGGVTISDGVLTVPAGVSTFHVTLPTNNDTVDENTEFVSIHIDGVTGTGTIYDDDTFAVSSVGDATVTEGGTLAFAVTLSGVSELDRSFSFSLSSDSADWSDYGDVTFSNYVGLGSDGVVVPAGVTEFTVYVHTFSDNVDESDETLTLSISGITGTGTITDDDTLAVSDVSSPTVVEGGSLDFNVTLTGSADTDKTFTFVLAEGTASFNDYSGDQVEFTNGVTYSDGMVTVPAGVDSFTVSIPTVFDRQPESGETIFVTVDGVEGTGTINDPATLRAPEQGGTVIGTAEDEIIFGSDNRDVLKGGGGDDFIVSKGGIDKVYGGPGDDTFVVGDKQDQIIEMKDEGNDTIIAENIDFTIAKLPNIENLVLEGSGRVGTGNGADNLIVGSVSNNILFGNGGDDTLMGGDGDDTLRGGTGADELTGGEGRDRFVFDSKPVPGVFDTITDFTAADDSIGLSKKVFPTQRSPDGSWFTDAFWTGTGAHDANDRLIFDDLTGALYYDPDGTGPKPMVEFAFLAGIDGTLTAANFTFV